MAADGHRVVVGMRNLASLLTVAARSPGFLPCEQETLTGAATALWQARSVLQTALDAPETHRRRAFGTPRPPSAPLPAAAPEVAIGMLEASQRLGEGRAVLTRRVRESGLGSMVNGEWRIPASALEQLRRRGNRLP